MQWRWSMRVLALGLLLLPLQAAQAAQFADNLVLITSGDAIALDQFSGSVAVPGISGRDADLLNIILTTSATSGTIPRPAGTLFVFRADPNPTAGDAAITAGERETVECQIAVAVSDWQFDVNGASAQLTHKPCRFKEALEQLFVVWFHQDAIAFATHGMKVSLRWIE